MSAEFDDASVWDRQSGEPARDYAAFRIYRDHPPTQRSFDRTAQDSGLSEDACRKLAQRWGWQDRAEAWDDACHHLDDQERLEAIRDMHRVHRSAGRKAVAKAVVALDALPTSSMDAGQIVRMLSLGAKLERDTLVVSVEELQGIEDFEDEADPWERIAAELTPGSNGDAADGG